MSCELYRNRQHVLEDFANGQVRPELATEIGLHLVACADCRGAVQSAQESVSLLRENLRPAGEPSAAFWTRLNAHLDHLDAQRLGAGDFWQSLELFARRFALGAAMGLLMLGSFAAGMELRPLVTGAQAPEVRELVPRSEQPPATHDEVLVSLAASEGRK